MGNFWGRKLSWIGEKCNFHEENFRGLLPLPRQRIPCVQILQRKLLWIATKLRNLCEFSAIRYTNCRLLILKLELQWLLWLRNALALIDCFYWQIDKLNGVTKLTNPNMKQRGHSILPTMGCCSQACLPLSPSLSIPAMTGMRERIRPTSTTPAQHNFSKVGFLRNNNNLHWSQFTNNQWTISLALLKAGPGTESG